MAVRYSIYPVEWVAEIMADLKGFPGVALALATESRPAPGHARALDVTTLVRSGDAHRGRFPVLPNLAIPTSLTSILVDLSTGYP